MLCASLVVLLAVGIVVFLAELLTLDDWSRGVHPSITVSAIRSQVKQYEVVGGINYSSQNNAVKVLEFVKTLFVSLLNV